MIYGAYGITVDSDIALPLPEATAPSTRQARIVHGTVDERRVRFAPVQGVDDDAELWIEMGWDSERTVLRFVGVVTDMVGDLIRVDAAETEDADNVAHLVVDHVIPRWLALHGDLVLHAGSVVSPRGHVVAFIGDPGRGKSSITTALGRAGWPVLGDDACRLVRHHDGWLAHPSYPGTRLLSDSRQALVPGAASSPMTGGADKHRVVAGVPHAEAAARLGLVVEIGGERDTVAAHALSFSQATASLTRHSFFLAPRLDELAPRAFSLSSALAADVPCLALEFPRRWDVYPELIATIERLEDSAA